MERVLFAPKVFLTLGPLKLLGRAETVREAVAAAIVSIPVLSMSGCSYSERSCLAASDVFRSLIFWWTGLRAGLQGK